MFSTISMYSFSERSPRRNSPEHLKAEETSGPGDIKERRGLRARSAGGRETGPAEGVQRQHPDSGDVESR